MIINSSSIGMDSARTYTSVSKEARLSSGIITSFSGALNEKALSKDSKAVSEDSPEAKEKSSETSYRNDFEDFLNKMKSYASSSSYERDLERQQLQTIRERCIQFLLQMIFGKSALSDSLSETNSGITGTAADSSDITQDIVVANHYSYSFSEKEETTFSTTGSVVTADGREISFNLDLQMSRSFTSKVNYTELVSTFTDPLVINLDSLNADVSDVKIRFDLDCDGKAEEINKLSSSSGYLALDLNGDGVINDGSELFGAKSGDGFADLAAYDSDGNGWIDEADEIFNKLKIYIQNEDGSQTLYNLKDKDVGAIYLGKASTEFPLNDLSTNKTNARIRSTGMFLYENGNVETLSQLDLAQ